MDDNMQEDRQENTGIYKILFYNIQHDWEDVLRSEAGTVWISCKSGDKLTHGKLKKHHDKIEATDGFVCKLFSPNGIYVRYANKSPCIFISANQVYNDIHKKAISSLDTHSNLLCVSSSENEAYVWNTTNGEKLVNLTGHVSDIYKVKWFPSGKVVLTAGADMQIKIWCSETGHCARTLKGHSRAITDLEIVEKGRNIISVSKDGYCKLWNCGTSDCIADLYNSNQVVMNCCSLSSVPKENLPESDVPTDEREVGTDDKILLIGCEDGQVVCIGVKSRKMIFSINLDSSVNCCSCEKSGPLFAVGCENGNVLLLDVYKKEIMKMWTYSKSAVKCIVSFKNKCITGHGDGSCIYHLLEYDKMCVHFSGSNCDAIYDLVCNENFVQTACRDGCIRKYGIQSIDKVLIVSL